MKKIKLIAIVATSIDGRIAQLPNESSTAWTSKQDKKFLFKILNQSDLIIVGRKTYQVAIKPLSKRNCLVLTNSVKTKKRIHSQCLFLNPNQVNLKKFLAKFRGKTVAILGGSQTYSLMLKLNLIDEIYLTIEPLIFGSGYNLFDCLIDKMRWQLVKIKKLNQFGTILLHYKKI
jgi:dihydrofolate reductase